METATQTVTLELVNAALARSDAPKSHKGKELLAHAKYRNPCVMAYGSRKFVAYMYTDETLSIEVFDAESVEGYQAVGVPNSGKTKIKYLLKAVAHNKGRMAKFVTIDGILKLALGKCDCATGGSGFRKLHALIPMTPLDAGEALRTAKRYRAAKRSTRSQKSSGSMGDLAESLMMMSLMGALTGSRPESAPGDPSGAAPGEAPDAASSAAPSAAPGAPPRAGPGTSRTIVLGGGGGGLVEAMLLSQLLGGGRRGQARPDSAAQGPAGEQ